MPLKCWILPREVCFFENSSERERERETFSLALPSPNFFFALLFLGASDRVSRCGQDGIPAGEDGGIAECK